MKRIVQKVSHKAQVSGRLTHIKLSSVSLTLTACVRQHIDQVAMRSSKAEPNQNCRHNGIYEKK